jgi:hypothetical protein
VSDCWPGAVISGLKMPPDETRARALKLPSVSAVPKLAAGTRYLKEQLSACGLKGLPPEECLKDFVLNATEAVGQTLQAGESYISCLCRHLDARARFILLWTSSDEPFLRPVWGSLIAVAQKHALERADSPTRKLTDA